MGYNPQESLENILMAYKWAIDSDDKGWLFHNRILFRGGGDSPNLPQSSQTESSGFPSYSPWTPRDP